MIPTKKRGVYETPYLTADMCYHDLSDGKSSCDLCCFQADKNGNLSLAHKIILADACVYAPCLGVDGVFYDNVKILNDKFMF